MAPGVYSRTGKRGQQLLNMPSQIAQLAPGKTEIRGVRLRMDSNQLSWQCEVHKATKRFGFGPQSPPWDVQLQNALEWLWEQQPAHMTRPSAALVRQVIEEVRSAMEELPNHPLTYPRLG